MFISFFFLSTTILLHFVCLIRAHKARPNGEFFFEKKASYKGDLKDFEKLLDNWIQKNSKLRWHKKEKTNFIVEEETGFLSYGFFYCFQLNKEKESWQVHIGVQAKLIPMTVEHRHQNCNPLSNMEVTQDVS